MISPACPYCGDELTDTPEEIPWNEAGDPVEVECGGCGELVVVRATVSIVFTATKTEDEKES